jgi:hypothetical protein
LQWKNLRALGFGRQAQRLEEFAQGFSVMALVCWRLFRLRPPIQ